jgi:hypothetical protein
MYGLLSHRNLSAVTDGMEVVLVPREAGKHFIWPGYDIGHKFEVPGVQHPVPERPVQLEMMVRDCHPGEMPGPCQSPSQTGNSDPCTTVGCLLRPRDAHPQSHTPKVFHVHNFLSEKEANLLVKKAQAKDNPYSIRPSTTGHKSWTQGGESSVASTRTSHNGFDVSSETAMAVKHRAFDLLRIPCVRMSS